ncbi:MAG: type II secretion system protein [Silanimonas sp.]
MRQRGFSLLEAMVTLVIISLVTTVLMQSLLYVLGVRERVLRNERESRSASLDEAWFRESIGSAIADVSERGRPFRGDASRVSFLGLDTLDGRAFSEVTWALVPGERGLSLEYRAGERRWALATGLPEGTAFRFRDIDGSWSAVWPVPEANAPDTSRPRPLRALPRAVVLAPPDGVDGLAWVASIGASPGLPLALEARESIRAGAL